MVPQNNRDDDINVGIMTVAAAAAAGVGIASFVLQPQTPLLQQGLAPPNLPQPGTFFGGGSPINPIGSTALAALSLTPLGLIPVAIFPPWSTPRTYTAVAVIFSESEQNGGGGSPGLISRRIASEMTSKLRSFSRRHYRKKPRESGLEIWKKMLKQKFSRMRQRSRCFGAKIVTKIKDKISDKFLTKKQRYYQGSIL